MNLRDRGYRPIAFNRTAQSGGQYFYEDDDVEKGIRCKKSSLIRNKKPMAFIRITVAKGREKSAPENIIITIPRAVTQENLIVREYCVRN